MKKLLVMGLSLAMVLGLATVSMAGSINTSGEIDAEYFNKHWTGESVGYTLMEVGVTNTIDINDTTTAHLNFWYESDQTQVQNYNIIDDAYLIYKFGGGHSLLVGKTRYWQLQGHFDSLSGFFRGALGSDDILEPPVSLVGTFRVNDNFGVTTGYFYNAANSTIQNYTGTAIVNDTTVVTPNSGTYSDDNGFNIPFVRVEYNKNNLSASAEVMQLSQISWLTKKPATDYMLDVAYKFGKYTVWAAYLGVAQQLDNNKIAGYDVGDTDNFGFIGVTASVGKFWISAEYGIVAPDSSNWIEYTDGSWHETNWSDDRPIGLDVSYFFGNNTTLKYTYATNTGNYSDKGRLRLIVKF